MRLNLPVPVTGNWPIHWREVSEQLYTWRVATRYPERKGTACRVLVRGKLNSCLVEFVDDGYRTVTSRNYVRKMDGKSITLEKYHEFLRAKVRLAELGGFEIDAADVNPLLKPHQVAAVIWAIRLGCAALFLKYGLGKTIIQLEILRIILWKTGGRGLITAPLGVRLEFMADAELLRTGKDGRVSDEQRKLLRSWLKGHPERLMPEIRFIKSGKEIGSDMGIYLTNYESVREGKIDVTLFNAAALDEADCLRAFGGSKTFREFMALFAGDRKTMDERTITDGVKYRFVATATPDPNEFIELLAYSAFLGVMEVSAAKTRFFKRDSTKADHLTIHPHKEREFWLWVSSWALFLNKPSDLGFSDEGYELPPLEVVYHELPVDHSTALPEKSGQGRMFRQSAGGVSEASKEKRETLDDRVQKLAELVAESPDDHFLLWHDLEPERKAIEKAVPESKSVYGSQPLDVREEIVLAFREGKIKYLAGKPQMLGSGPNFQYHCHRAIFVGVGYKFKDFIQAIHRLYRFLQTHGVRIDIIFAESERTVLERLQEKWRRHDQQAEIMSEIIQTYGLSHAAMQTALTRGMGIDRAEIKSDKYTIVNNDAIEECAADAGHLSENSVGLIVSSIPFSTQYEYSPNFADLGHTDNNEHFFEQMDYLTPNLLRVLQPGRLAIIHVKDRIVPGGLTGLGFQTVYPFSDETVRHFCKHGFAFMGRRTVTTDVVRENAQTYRLAYTQQCIDGTKMGCGMSEYLLMFRKPPTDNSNGYADEPVAKSKDEYSLARWQVDAHGYWRSSGNRLMTSEELQGVPHERIYKIYKQFSLDTIYDHEQHVRLGDNLKRDGRLPTKFMVMPPHSADPSVWTDITRMKTLNSRQYSMGRQMHLCPLQIDIVDRCIRLHSMAGELVLDPFGGIGTVASRAVALGRTGYSIELSPDYFMDSKIYCQLAEMKMASPTLFDIEPEESEKEMPVEV